MADSGPSINVKLDPAVFAAVDQVGSAVKAQRAVVRDLEREVRAMAKTGQDVSKDLAGRLSKARTDLENLEGLKAAGRGRSGGGSSGPSFRRGDADGGGAFGNESLGHTFRHDRRAFHETAEIARGFDRGGPEGAGDILRGASGLAGRGTALGVGLVGLALAVRELDAGLKDNEQHFEARKAARVDVAASQQDLGERATEKLDAALLKRFKDAEVKKLGWFDRGAQRYDKRSGNLIDMIVRGGSDALGFSTRDGALEKQAEDELKKGLEAARHHAEQAYKAAGLGDVGRAEKEINAANVAVRNQFNIQETFGSAVELYLRQENVRRARAEYTQFQQRRGTLRTGD